MFTLFCSFDKYHAWKMYKEIATEFPANSIHSFSISTVIPDTTTVQMIHRQFEDFHRQALKNVSEGMYYICQLQHDEDPDDTSFISPLEQIDVEKQKTFMWHNMIIKQDKLFLVITKEDADLYYDDQLNISTKQFPDFKQFDRDVMYQVDLVNKKVSKYVA